MAMSTRCLAPGTAALALAACVATPAIAARPGLGFDELMSGSVAIDGPVPNAYYVPVGHAGEARHRFSGTLHVPEHAMLTEPAEILPVEIGGKKTQLFPGIDLSFVSHDGYLVPVRREVLVAPEGDSFWQVQVEPGRVWSEEGDGGMSRASFPFVLTSIIENETYNGIATFLYDDKVVSRMRYQVVQQLTPFMIQTRFVATGQAEISYRADSFDERRLIASFEQELRDRLPWREWSELEQQYGTEAFADFDSGIDPAETVTSGLVVDGRVYVRSMATPYGDYPFPREMRHGVWSVTKTAAGLLMLLRMAQKYGDEVLDYRIRDYVEVSATHDGWDRVRFRDAINMATGIGVGSLQVDPNDIDDAYIGTDGADTDAYMAWYLAPTRDEKLGLLFRVPKFPWGPGKVARYRDRDIFTLSAALDGLYRKREGDDADIWQMMLDEVYGPIGIHHLPMNRTREHGGTGIPILAWGIYLTIDDAAKIAMLLQDGGKHRGVQILSRAGVAEALDETAVRGLPTGGRNAYGEQTYHLALWHDAYRTSSGTVYSVPRMSGYGGNIVLLMPNGIVGFRFGNGGNEPLERMIVIADGIRPFDRNSRH